MKALTLYQLIGDVDDKLVAEARPEHKHRRHIRPLLLAAVIALLLAGFAEATQGSISDLFAPLFRSSRTEIIDNIGRPVSAAATSDGYTVTAEAVVGDRNTFAVVYTLTRDDGQPIPENIRFDGWRNSLLSFSGSGSGYLGVADVEGLPANQVRLTEQHDLELPILWRHAHVTFRGLRQQVEDGMPGEGQLLAEGPWELDFTLRYKDATVKVPVNNLTVTDAEGWTYTIHKVQLSPLSVTMHLDIPNYYYEMDADEARSYEIDHNWTHMLNVSLRMKDGGGSPFISNGGTSGGKLSAPTLKAVYNGQFDPPVLPDEVEAIIVCGTEIPVK